jgi:hypothetical protein
LELTRHVSRGRRAHRGAKGIELEFAKTKAMTTVIRAATDRDNGAARLCHSVKE